MFAYGSPILAGIDSPSLYCYLLAQEKRRDAETWAIHLYDLYALIPWYSTIVKLILKSL